MRELPQRKPNRLIDYNYAQNGAYFITICTKDHLNLFATINGTTTAVGAATCRPYTCHPHISPPHIELSDIGQIVDLSINNIPQKYSCVSVNTYVIMPNHLHMILIIEKDNGRQNNSGRQVAAPTVTVQTIIGHLKRFVSMQCGFSVWQKSFHDHIIRDDLDYRRIAQYIADNPYKWTEDCYFKRTSL